MPHQLIAELKEGARLKQCFLLRRVESRTTRSGKPFLSLVLADKSGTINAKVWEDALNRWKISAASLVPSDFVAVTGQVELFDQDLQINVTYITAVKELEAQGRTPPDFDPELLIPITPYDREQLWEELKEMAAANLSPPMRELVLALLDRHRDDLMSCPAARIYHHPYLGGLLEHTWSVARHTLASLKVYPDLNLNVALAGAILHDLGKVKEITNPQAPDLTVAGQLLGHIVLGWEMVREEARTQEFSDPDLLVQLEHIILSHHGSLEFGSPVLPKTREALLVYFLDDLDAKLKMMDQHLQSDAGEGDFTSYHRGLQRGLFKGADSRAPGRLLKNQKNS